MRKVIREMAMAFVLFFLVSYGLAGVAQAVQYELVLTETAEADNDWYPDPAGTSQVYGDVFMNDSPIGIWHLMSGWFETTPDPSTSLSVWQGYLDITGRGKLFFQGGGDPGVGTADGAVTGGTGDFTGLRGTLEVTETAPDTYSVILDVWR